MPHLGFVQNVIMHKSGDMDEFNDYGQSNVLFGNPPRRSTRQERQAWAETLGRAPKNVLDMLAKARIKAADLVRQRDFHPRQFSRNRFQQFQKIATEMCRERSASAQCRPQHSTLTLRATRKGV